MEYKVGDKVILTDKTLAKLKDYPIKYTSGVIIQNFLKLNSAKVKHDDGNIWGWSYDEIMKLPKQ